MLEVRSLEQITVMKAPALVRMAIIPVTPEALDRAARLAGSPKDKEPDVQKRIDAAAPLVAEVKVLGMCSTQVAVELGQSVLQGFHIEDPICCPSHATPPESLC